MNTQGGSGTGCWQVDLHVHTCYSPDSLMRLDQVVAAVARRGLGALAITDHNAIDGALALAKVAPFPVIVGEEIDTGDGEVIGLFLHEFIAPRLGPHETVRLIKQQGGVVYVPHPFDSHRFPLRELVLEALVPQIDLIEVLNARVNRSAFNARAQTFARQHNLPGGAGSDAHTPGEIGRAYVAMEPFVGREDFLSGIARATVGGGVSGFHVHLLSTLAKVIKRRRAS